MCTREVRFHIREIAIGDMEGGRVNIGMAIAPPRKQHDVDRSLPSRDMDTAKSDPVKGGNDDEGRTSALALGGNQ